MGGALSGRVLRRPGVWIAVFLLGCCALVNLYSTQPILVEITRWGDVSVSEGVWTISAATLGIVVVAPLAGSVSDRLGRKRVMVVAIVGMIIATSLCALAPTFSWLLLLRFLQGVATPFVFTVAVAYISEESTGSQTAVLNGVYVAGTAFGGFIGRFLAGWAVDVTGSWQASFAGPVLILAAALMATWCWLPPETAFRPARTLVVGLRGMGVHLRDWRVLGTCLVGASLLFQQVVSFTYGALYLLGQPFVLSALQVSLVFVVFLAPTAIIPFVGVLITRWGVVVTYCVSAALGGVGLVLTLVPVVGAVVVGLMLSCVAVFAGQSCATGFLGRHCRAYTSAAVGLYLTFYYLGGTIGGFVPAPLYLHAGWPALVALLAGCAIIGTVVAAFAWRPLRTRGATLA